MTAMRDVDSEGRQLENATVLVDAHVHFHRCYAPSVFFDSALGNFQRAAMRLGVGPYAGGLLAFTETAEADYFHQFQNGAGPGRMDRWRIRRTAESVSVIAERHDGRELFLVAGRQVTTHEDVEVLALGCDRRLPDNHSLSETIELVREIGAIPVLPWGFGKWWFRRGALVADLLGSINTGVLFLGDNAGRWRRGPRPRLFGIAASRGIRILPGTDPLPFAAQATKPGRYGFALAGRWDRDRPAASLKRLLAERSAQPMCYGELEGLAAFGLGQARMLLRKRLHKLWRKSSSRRARTS